MELLYIIICSSVYVLGALLTPIFIIWCFKLGEYAWTKSTVLVLCCLTLFIWLPVLIVALVWVIKNFGILKIVCVEKIPREHNFTPSNGYYTDKDIMRGVAVISATTANESDHDYANLHVVRLKSGAFLINMSIFKLCITVAL